MRARSQRSKWVARLAIAATSASIGLVGTGAVLSPASADTPVKAAWWNFASGGGQAAPAPDTNAGGLRVGVSSSQTLAFGAVEYNLPRDGSGTLELAITSITSGSGAPQVNAILACPTKDDSWKAGDNQDASTAPGYNCDTFHFVGHLSADETTMTFQVDGSADITDGVLSLAIVPQHSTAVPYVGTDPGTGSDLTPPFVVDFDKPGSNSFVSEDSSSSSSSSSDSSSGSSAPPPPSDTGSTGTSSTPSFPAPPASSDVSVPAATTDAGANPVVAPQQPATTSGTAPAAAVAPAAKTDNSKHDLLLVLLILLLFAILYTQNAQQRAPRRIAATAPPGQPATEAATLPIPYPVGLAPRGLGRFTKPRTEAARPLI
jgi:hypothetical protein